MHEYKEVLEEQAEVDQQAESQRDPTELSA
jgi:hypothetical protein